MSEEEEKSCCAPDVAQSCCQPGSATSMEEAVKKSYGQLWANQRESKSAGSRESLKSLMPAHEALLKELKPQKGMKVLDIGSGSGETVLTIAERVKPTGKAVGVDFSPEGIALAKERAKQRKLESVTEFHQTNAMNLPFPDNTFDAVISECVVCLIQDKQKALNEKVRVLKPGGRVIMHDVITRAPMPKAMREDQRLYCGCIGGAVSLRENVEMMKTAGLTDIKTVDFTRKAKVMIKTDVGSQSENLKKNKAAREIVDFVQKGGIGYALIVGTKKSTT